MMASIPNMRSTPLPVPTTKSNPAGDPASGGFTVQLPVPLEQAFLGVPPPVQLPLPVEPVDGAAPQIPVPEEGSQGETGDDAAPAKAETAKDDKEAAPAVVIPFVQPQVLAAPVPQVPPVATGTEAPAPQIAGAAPIPLPRASGGTGKKAVQAPDLPVAPKADQATEADAPALEAAVKALLQRKPVAAKQVAAAPKPTPADTAKTDPAAVKEAPQPAQPTAMAPAPVAPATIQVAAPLTAAELPQPALSPAAAQPAPATTDKAAAVDATRSSDLAVERKLDLSRDSAWLDRLARDIARSASDDSPLRFRLHPQTLGHLQVELQQGDRGTAVRMTVDTEAARQILADAQPRLTAEARAQGVRIAETHVDLSGSGRHAPGDQRRQDEARQTPLIRTATGAGAEADAAARASRRARLDRYA